VLWIPAICLDGFDVLRPEEIEIAVGSSLRSATPRHGRIYALLDPALERFSALSEEDCLDFKDALDKFVARTHSCLKIVSFRTQTWNGTNRYCRALAAYIRSAETVERLTWAPKSSSPTFGRR